jgi:hypothetical protein
MRGYTLIFQVWPGRSQRQRNGQAGEEAGGEAGVLALNTQGFGYLAVPHEFMEMSVRDRFARSRETSGYGSPQGATAYHGVKLSITVRADLAGCLSRQEGFGCLE